jgi:hypothetical protein
MPGEFIQLPDGIIKQVAFKISAAKVLLIRLCF